MLQYLNFTRPDISYAVNQASRSMHSPQSVDWSRLKYLLRYLKGTVIHDLYFSKYSPMSLTSFSDVDWTVPIVDQQADFLSISEII